MNQIPQSGFIPVEPKPEDYVIGGITGVSDSSIRIATGDWTLYLPYVKAQSTVMFDTLSCVTFSAISTIETQLNYLYSNSMLTDNANAFLISNGFVQGGKVSFSRRFTAIMSKTTKDGNTFPNVWDSIRYDGLLPDVILPFGGSDFSSYHNPNNILPTHINLAKQLLSYFDIKYEWIILSSVDGQISTTNEKVSVSNAKQQAPLQMAIPFPAHHATTLMSDTEIFDSYTPYIFSFSDSYPVQYIMRGIISEKVPIIAYHFSTALGKGDISNDVIMLQKFLNATDTPIGNYGKETNYFGDMTQQALSLFQKKWNILPSIGFFGPATMAKVNSFCSNPVVSSLDKWALAIQTHEGYYSGSASYRNNNPGNIRYAKQANTTGSDSRNFAVFLTYADGFQALKNLLSNAATGKSSVYKPTDTIYNFFAKYAPDSDGNNSVHYAESVASAIGVSANSQIKTLI